jgi:hypothetical protein
VRPVSELVKEPKPDPSIEYESTTPTVGEVLIADQHTPRAVTGKLPVPAVITAPPLTAVVWVIEDAVVVLTTGNGAEGTGSLLFEHELKNSKSTSADIKFFIVNILIISQPLSCRSKKR